MSAIRNKQRLIHLYRYLMENTDEEHQATTNELVEFLRQEDANVSRKTVKDDIDVLIEEGGMKKLVVSDNGIGMDSADAEMAFQRHATSKIRSQNSFTVIPFCLRLPVIKDNKSSIFGPLFLNFLIMIRSCGSDRKIVIFHNLFYYIMHRECSRGWNIKK